MYSIATSRYLKPEYLDYWARIKGVDLLGTGDITHPVWLKDLKKQLVPAPGGFYSLNPKYALPNPYFPDKQTSFVPTGEVCCIFKRDGVVKRVHLLCVLPDLKAAEKFQKKLAKKWNVKSDGRPILATDPRTVLKMLLDTDKNAFMVPAHIWTPHFSLLGANSGFDSLEECFGDLSDKVFAVETGLSSDPAMNRLCGFLDRVTLLSNSDAHSPDRIGREANIFETEFSYRGMLNAIKTKKGFVGTVEFFPQEGKYYMDGHRACDFCLTPEQTDKLDGRCPSCGKKITKGVCHRVRDLSTRKTSVAEKKVYYTVPLDEVIGQYLSCGRAGKKAKDMYFDMIKKVGAELDILLFTDTALIAKDFGDRFASGIANMRDGRVKITEGFDGKYGEIMVFSNTAQCVR